MSLSIGVLSTYPPTQSGLATSAASLYGALTAGSTDPVGVVRVLDAPAFSDRPEVVAHLLMSASGSVAVAGAALERYDAVVVQHDYDVFDNTDADHLVGLLHRLEKPVILMLNTVLRRPTPDQQRALEMLTDVAGAVVVMTETARERLHDTCAVAAEKVHVIQHGALEQPAVRMLSSSEQPMILTWGLLAPGKGIEWAIAGLREVRHLTPRPRYVIAGQTHPKVLSEEGESYRLGLYKKVRAFGVSDLVRFERSYVDPVTLARLVGRADVVLLPYDSSEQAASAVLLEAVAAGKPVIATRFPHAVELLGSGAGLLVPYRDGKAIGAALKRVLTEPDLVESMLAEGAKLTGAANWSTVANRYRELAALLCARGGGRRATTAP